ncbi:tRNA 2'-phosphotransferase 1 [Melia azedarach]|uniref:tRNA 2'-phosphotransferase 1 n=1 Tax=Melia azedarach TaxID=155640 RepID=A0ACC1YUI0_MELAZ|nr:tRNA 2'-phosphotransferase 1 [Melia azedarach]
MWGCISSNIISIRILCCCCCVYRPRFPISAAFSSSLLSRCLDLGFMENTNRFNQSSSFASFAQSSKSGGGARGRGFDIKNDNERWKGRRGGGGGGKDKIDALGRLLTRILRHMASELNLNMRSDGYVKVQDLLKLNMKTFAQIPLRSHTVDDIREAVRKDNKQRFSLLEENGELLIRANQGHTVTTVESESLLKPILLS